MSNPFPPPFGHGLLGWPASEAKRCSLVDKCGTTAGQGRDEVVAYPTGALISI